MNEIQVFENVEFGKLEIVMIEGKEYFPAIECAEILGYARARNAIATHCPHALKRGVGVQTGTKSDGTPAMQTVEKAFIPEGDLYRLIIRSKLPSAERFERWVFDEVLPSIRKRGMYATPMTAEAMLNNPDLMIQLLQNFKNEQDRRREVEQQNALLAEANEQLTLENRILNGEIFEWDFSSLLNALVRAYAGQAQGNQFGIAWSKFYTEVKYNLHLNLEKRRTEAGKKDPREKKRALYMFLKEEEELPAIQTMIALCDRAGMEINDILMEHIGDRLPQAV